MSSDDFFMNAVVEYATRHQLTTREQTLVNENNQLRTYIHDLTDKYNALVKAYNENLQETETLLDPLHKDGSRVDLFNIKCLRVYKYLDILLRSYNVDPNDKKAKQNLPLNTKRIINVHILAFIEREYLNIIGPRWVAENLRQSMNNIQQEANILARAISENNTVQMLALQAWGYLQMTLGVLEANKTALLDTPNTLSHETDNNNAWLKGRVEHLLSRVKFAKDSAIPLADSIPHPLYDTENGIVSFRKKQTQLSRSISGDRPEYRFDISKKASYPNNPKGFEVIRGPVIYNNDVNFLWGQALLAADSETPTDELVQAQLNNERFPVMLNNSSDVKFATQNKIAEISNFIERVKEASFIK